MLDFMLGFSDFGWNVITWYVFKNTSKNFVLPSRLKERKMSYLMTLLVTTNIYTYTYVYIYIYIVIGEKCVKYKCESLVEFQWQAKPKQSDKNLSNYHFVVQKFHTVFTVLEFGLPRWEPAMNRLSRCMTLIVWCEVVKIKKFHEMGK